MAAAGLLVVAEDMERAAEHWELWEGCEAQEGVEVF